MLMTRLTTDLHPFLTLEILSKLFEKSVATTSTFICQKPAVLANITGLQYDQILKVKDRILSKFSSPLKRGDKYYEDQISRCSIISTGVPQIDTLLEGGLLTGQIYEVCGFEASGKTQLCLSVALNICQTTSHNILILDTKYDITSNKLQQIILARNLSSCVNQLLNKILISHPTSASKLLNDLHLLKFSLQDTTCNYSGTKVIIIDSLSVLFQTFYSVTEGLSVLNNIANILKYLASQFNLVILITNFISSWSAGFNVLHSESEHVSNAPQTETPALGKYWAHVPNTRINITRLGCKDECCLTLMKSRNQQIGILVKVQITDSGLL